MKYSGVYVLLMGWTCALLTQSYAWSMAPADRAMRLAIFHMDVVLFSLAAKPVIPFRSI